MTQSNVFLIVVNHFAKKLQELLVQWKIYVDENGLVEGSFNPLVKEFA